MTSYEIEIDHSDLASRQAAAELRAKIESHIQNGEHVAISFEKVFSISESYADELFGVLVLRYGLDWLADNIGLEHINSASFKAIASAIHQRLSLSEPNSPNIALLVARKALKQRRSHV
jgi:STAS-like domain of unknown function (DUF4325)